MLTKLLIGLIISLTLLSSHETTEPTVEESATLCEPLPVISEEELNECAYTRLSFDESEPAAEMISFYRFLNDSDHTSFGLIDTNGALVCPPVYDWAGDSSEGYSVVHIDAEHSDKEYYDVFGNLIENDISVCTYVNLKGKECFGYYSNALNFSEGVAFVKDANQNWHAMNKNGEIIHSFDEGVESLEPFSEELALFRTKDGKNGFINHDFAIAIPAVYSYAENFSDGLAVVSIDGGNLAYINKNCELQVHTNISFEKIERDSFGYFATYDRYQFSEGFAALTDYDKSGEPIRHYYINNSGETVIDNVFGTKFTHGLAAVHDEITDTMGFIDKTGEYFISPIYSKAFPFNEDGLALVYGFESVPNEYINIDISSKYFCGYINTKGEVVIPLEYCTRRLWGNPIYANGIIELYKEGYTYFFNSDGEIIGKTVENNEILEEYEKLKN